MNRERISQHDDAPEAKASGLFQEPRTRELHRKMERHDLRKTVSRLRTRNAYHQEKIAHLTDEIREMDEVLSNLRREKARYMDRIRKYPDIVGKRIHENELLTAKVHRLRQNIKSVESDEESTLLLIDTLMEEYRVLEKDKAELTRRIHALHRVLEELNQEKREKLPRLKKYDAMLKNALYEMQETQNSMDISVKLRQRRTGGKPVGK